MHNLFHIISLYARHHNGKFMGNSSFTRHHSRPAFITYGQRKISTTLRIRVRTSENAITSPITLALSACFTCRCKKCSTCSLRIIEQNSIDRSRNRNVFSIVSPV
ncbi:hypothetical protein CEXT_114441 [Caerostris extrusa]|uniref:Uncharacterized protein n=1 Tax=Caerostris extrusa TaxID=172846 RepID=A0AAV4R5D2_CAEEX|nr:hypothetical protein CEXT_114441 [Caerostris extrusa]